MQIQLDHHNKKSIPSHISIPATASSTRRAALQAQSTCPVAAHVIILSLLLLPRGLSVILRAVVRFSLRPPPCPQPLRLVKGFELGIKVDLWVTGDSSTRSRRARNRGIGSASSSSGSGQAWSDPSFGNRLSWQGFVVVP
jgi:hypothetical protein